MQFFKMHALGNNYVFVDTKRTTLPTDDVPSLARRVSDVRRGIGSDGLILVTPSERADVGMRIWNADGSEAESCGNGLRCVARYAYERGLVDATHFSIETKAGVVAAQVHLDVAGRVRMVTIDMGVPRFGTEAVRYLGRDRGDDVRVDVGEARYTGTLVNMGNPHFVALVDRVDDVDVESIGRVIESHPNFPDRINVEFVAVLDSDEIDFRVYERGSGVTFACGTGACASVAALARKGYVGRRVTVHLLGGDLDIELRDDGHVWMTGEAHWVCEGTYYA
ncbi:diaminopimelate epimerase [Alicyclobacillus vulcanalis]|uniref:Diaminopimelate epimerase n=1 Tax=Alicyclobacillus vulcanalis TaxID=252246 RepID=A0A1N7KTX4_9BACL|nr:diaminopimelate epimerase [Alicyclobacillus vulcanalis]SIS65068.1 diaminopimelate epimerase [Alicyclobacillus vulcanalis]